MSVTRKKGDIIAISVSIVIAMFLAGALIYGSEYRRRKDLEELHERVLRSTEVNVAVAPEKQEETNVKETKLTEPEKDAKKTSSGTSFADMIRAMPSDTNTPLQTPDYDDDDSMSNAANDPCDKQETTSVTGETGNSVTKRPVKETNTKAKTKADTSIKTKTDKLNKPCPDKAKSKAESRLHLPKSENIVPFEPPRSLPEPTFYCKDEIEAIRRQIAAKKSADKQRIELKRVDKPVDKPPIKTPPKPPSRSRSNIIFDPVPGLFPKMFVDRFFKKRRVRVIIYGPKNTKKEYVMEGDKGGDDKLADKLTNDNTQPTEKLVPVPFS